MSAFLSGIPSMAIQTTGKLEYGFLVFPLESLLARMDHLRRECRHARNGMVIDCMNSRQSRESGMRRANIAFPILLLPCQKLENNDCKVNVQIYVMSDDGKAMNVTQWPMCLMLGMIL